MKQFLPKGNAFVLWQKDMNNSKKNKQTRKVGPPGPDAVAAADLQDEDQRHPRVE